MTLSERPVLRVKPPSRTVEGAAPAAHKWPVVPSLPLRPGATIALILPSGPPNTELTRAGIEILRGWGYRPVVGPLLSLYLEEKTPAGGLPFLSAPDEDRLADLRWGLQGPCDACWAVRGGHGLNRLLPALDAEAMSHPRPVLGFSDVTALLSRLQRRHWPDLVHAANVQTLPRLSRSALDATRALLHSGEQPSLDGRVWREGEAEGILCGGNLCVLTALCGTPDRLEARDRILFLEDVNEAPYRVDRLLAQLDASGSLEGLRGLLLGRFEGCADVAPVLQHWSVRLGVPTVADLPVGHGEENHPLRLGHVVRLAQGTITGTPISTSSASGAEPS